jgi:hypothetical protein
MIDIFTFIKFHRRYITGQLQKDEFPMNGPQQRKETFSEVRDLTNARGK